MRLSPQSVRNQRRAFSKLERRRGNEAMQAQLEEHRQEEQEQMLIAERRMRIALGMNPETMRSFATTAEFEDALAELGPLSAEERKAVHTTYYHFNFAEDPVLSKQEVEDFFSSFDASPASTELSSDDTIELAIFR